MMFFTLICAVPAEAQTPAVNSNQQSAISNQQSAELPAATVREQLPDGSYIVVIAGVAYKAIDEPTLRGILESNKERDKAVRARVELEKQIKFYEENSGDFAALIKVANEQRDKEASIAGNFKTLYEGEHDLRLKAEKLYAPPGKVSGFFQHPVVQLAEKIGKPIFENWLATRGRQTTVVMSYDQIALLQSQQQWSGRPKIVLKL